MSGRAWRCTVCGYIHRGDGPPDCCPICGAAREDFESFTDEVPAAAAPVARWRCTNCNYVHEGPEPPAECPVCGAAAELFESVSESVAGPGAAAGAFKALVIGAGIAGVSAAESVRQAAPGAGVTLVSKEERPPYYRLNLTRYLAGEIGSEVLPLHDEGWYATAGIRLVSGAEAVALDPERRSVTLGDGEEMPFDKLILAVGSHPFVPPLPGVEREGVMTLRTVEDAERLLDAARRGRPCVCIGGGILGLETAGALARRGADVTVLESHGYLMPRQLCRRAGELLGDHLHRLKIKLKTEARTSEIVGDGGALGVRLEGGELIKAGVAVLATGVRSNTHLARRAGLAVKNGVVVDDHMATSHPDIFAAGDLAEHRGVLYGTWAPAQYQGSIAGLNAAGVPTAFGGIPRSNTLKVLGLDLVSLGRFEPEDGSYTCIEDEGDGTYFRFVFRDNLLVGAILLGDSSSGSAVKKAIEGRADFSSVLARHPKVRDVIDYLGSASR